MYSAYTAGVIDRYHDVDACNSCMGAAKSLLRAALIAHSYTYLHALGSISRDIPMKFSLKYDFIVFIVA